LMDSVYLTESDKQKMCLPMIASQIDVYDPFSEHRKYYRKVSNADFLNQMLYVDCKTFMPSLNLNYNDKMSMASSVEVRVPFLDWELAEWVAWNVPPNLKLHEGTTKHIFREAMRPILPAEVLVQSKAGFGAPVANWITNDLQEMLQDVLSAKQIESRGLFDSSFVHKLINEHIHGQQDWSMQIWQLLTLELWQQEFLD
jgi:asparagine synthase (glutamine-hydrolysing)